MDFLRSVEEDLHGLIYETKKKLPAVRDAAEKGLEQIVLMRQMYAQSMRVDAAPGPGHAVFKSDAILQPFLLVCNHATASQKLLISCFNSIQRLVSWDAITTEAVSNILRVLQIQAERNNSQDIQLKLLQTLLQLLTLAFTNGDEQMTKDDLISQAMWICLHLQSQSGNPITANTAAMTVRQIVTMVFDNVLHHATADEAVRTRAKNVGFLVFQDLCLMSREEAGVWLKRTTFSKLLGVELVEAVLTSHAGLFRDDVEFRSMLKQHIKTLVTMNLDSLLAPAAVANPSTFPLLLRIMRLAGTVLSHFSALLPDECLVIWLALLEIVSTGSYSPSSPSSSSSTGKSNRQRADRTTAVVVAAPLTSASGSSAAPSTIPAPAHHVTINYVTWPVLLAMEVVSKACHEPEVLPALALYPQHVLLQIARHVAAVVTLSPPADYKPSHDTTFYRSGLEYLNDVETPTLQPFYHCLRLSAICLGQMVSALTTPSLVPLTGQYMLTSIAPFVLNASTCLLRFCRDAELVNLALKSLHGLSSAEASFRGHLSPSVLASTRPVGVACLQTLCVFSFPIVPASRVVKCVSGSGYPSMVEYLPEDLVFLVDEPLLTWKEIQAMKTLFRSVHTMENDLNTPEWRVLLEGFEILVALSNLKQKAKGVHTKMGTGPQALKVEDEDVEQQLVMLGFSVTEYFQNSTNDGILGHDALLHVLKALQRICLGQLQSSTPEPDDTDTATTTTLDDNSALTSALADVATNEAMLAWDVVSIPYSSHLRVYDQTLGLSSVAGAPFSPSFAIRLFVQLAKQHPTAWAYVIRELVALSCAPTSSLGASFQAFTTDAVFQLMQSAIASTHAMAQEDDVCGFMLQLLASETMKERALAGVLDFLQACGHLLTTGWPTVLATLQSSAALDARCQVVAFKSVRLVVDDLLGNMPLTYRRECIGCVGAFASSAKDVNVSLTAVNALWSISDAIAKQATDVDELWPRALGELRRIASDPRPEVRNCAINTLFGMAVTHGTQFQLPEWQLCLEDTVLPLGMALGTATVLDEGAVATPGLRTHHSRDSVAKQYDESRVLVLSGLARVVQTHGGALIALDDWFPSMWSALLTYIGREAAHASSEVVLAAVQTLHTLLQVVSVDGVDASATPLRAGVGMRMVDGTLAPADASASTASARKPMPPTPVVIWDTAFDLLLSVAGKSTTDHDADVAAAVVLAIVQLYNQCRDHECKTAARVAGILALFEACMDAYVFSRPATITGGTTNSVHARIINAYDDCAYFTPAVHRDVIAQVLTFLVRAQSLHITVLVKHLLSTLAKLVERIAPPALSASAREMLTSIQPSLDTKTQDVSTAAATLTSAEKAALGLWRPAVPVLQALTTHALPVAPKMAPYLLATIATVLGPAPRRDDDHDDETLELNVLDKLVESMVGRVPPSAEGTARFMDLLTASSGRRPAVASACVQHLIALGSVANTNGPLRQACRIELLSLANDALGAYQQRPTEHRERVLTLLSTLGASPLSPRNVLVLFPSLCACISCDDAEIRSWIQRILLESNVAATCLALLHDDVTQ
ncbi:hypothetical protein, variant [Saprolegnia diclina VS20]|uniref:Protein MON2 homolog n=1 Tax=Saprolegnia diclina (strain VS20) TaxID=1156394 RepID=T0QI72_SAPDV|nr:hypothetical protein SDRG_04728 [Saprolegnia diclina VS20]XP_008608633.1 hypothetical protein, variant [Saprolegnia diclina VS20]EQC37699.1 hypothetical protein SDRG_04728 [Saprolegnia diclina VS20]EQC37700.1 hypothetical protein, variant [Saprolegnia diclina VS20]|eukprot:XP_008608632.1 hypothetical protein SDRG_04728 [Saprolegnia diclina VS20]